MTKRGVALVTGASSGIGEATAIALARAGYAVAVAARRADLLEQLVQRIEAAGGIALSVPTDMRDPLHIEQLVQRVHGQLGAVDVLVNNAGVGAEAASWKLTDAQIALVIETNLVAPMRLTRALLPEMLARGHGHIINIGSVAGHVALPGSGIYGASKFALRGWNDALRREVRSRGIHVSLVAPGFIRTEMTASLHRLPIPGPELVAGAIVKLLRRPRRELVVPWYYTPLMVLAEHVPAATDIFLGWRRRSKP